MTVQMKPLSTGSHRAVSVFLRFIAVIFGLGILLHAQIARAEAPDRSFAVVKTDANGVTIEIGKDCSVDTVIRAFQRQFRASTATPENPAGEELNWRQIYEVNKGHVIPACKVPGDGYSYSRSRSPDVWLRCPDVKDQRLILIQGPSDRIRIPMSAVETTQQKLERLAAQDSCLRNPTDECLTATAKAAHGKKSIELKTSSSAPSVSIPAPVPLGTAPTPPAPTPVVKFAEPANDAQVPWAFVMFLTCVCIAGIFHVSGLRRSHKREIDRLMTQLVVAQSDDERASIKKLREEYDANLQIERSNLAAEKEKSGKYIGTISSNAEAMRKLGAENEAIKVNAKAFADRLDSAKQALLSGALKFGFVLPQQAGLADSIQSVFTQVGSAYESLKRERNDAQRELSSITAATKRLAEVYHALSVLDPRLIQIDDRLTDVHEQHEELRALFDHQVANGDPASAETQARIEEYETEMRPLVSERESLTQQLELLRPEFEELHMRLTGFELNRDRLYQEAQRDRNEAAAEMGRARATMQAAETKRAYVQRAEERLRQDRAAIEAERETLVEAKINIDHQSTVVRGLFRELLEAADLPPETTLENIEQRGAVSGLIAEVIARVREMERVAESYNASLRRSSSDAEDAQRIIEQLKGEKAKLTARVSELMRDPQIEVTERPSALPPLPKDLYSLVGNGDAQSPESPTNGRGHAGGSENPAPSSDQMHAVRAALKSVGKGATYVVESVEDLLALCRFSEDVIFDADPLRLCVVHGHVSTQVERITQIEKVRAKLSNLRLGDVKWVLEQFQQYMAVPSVVRTIVPAAGAAPPPKGAVTPGGHQPPD